MAALGMLLLTSAAAAQVLPGARQTRGGPPAPEPAGRALRVFIDCVDVSCDGDFFRTDITFVDHVRDRADADVHALVTAQTTGGGGREYSIALIGRGRFEKVDHTLTWVAQSTDTDDIRRRGVSNTLKLGLVRYVADTPVGRELKIAHDRAAVALAQARDPWDYWVFKTSVQGSASGEESTKYFYLYGSASANRVTSTWKIQTSASTSYSQNSYAFSGGDSYSSFSRTTNASALVVKSLGSHWAAGGLAGLSSSTYLNQRLRLRLAPAIEYNVFPYSESTRRQLTFNYAVGVNRFRYRETTIFDKNSETLFNQALTLSLDLRQPWGSTSTSLEASHYLNDGSKNKLVLYNNLDVRLFKGFSLSAYGSLSRVRDQLYLSKGTASVEDVLVRRRQLSTSYQYYVSAGISYRFGSIFNNVVNSRFASY